MCSVIICLDFASVQEPELKGLLLSTPWYWVGEFSGFRCVVTTLAVDFGRVC